MTPERQPQASTSQGRNTSLPVVHGMRIQSDPINKFVMLCMMESYGRLGLDGQASPYFRSA